MSIHDKTPEEINLMVSRVVAGLGTVPPGEDCTMFEIVGRMASEGEDQRAARMFADLTQMLLPDESPEVVAEIMDRAATTIEFVSDGITEVDTIAERS